MRRALKNAFAACVVLLTGLTWTSQAAAVSCTLSATALSLGTYAALQALPNDAAGSATVTCTKGLLEVLPLTVNYTLTLSTGSGTYATRTLRKGPRTLSYNLYRDVLRTQVFGDGTGGSFTVSGIVLIVLPIGVATSTELVYGRLPANQNAYAGSYSDTIVVTALY